jgi:Capsule assembly protein Wzi
MALPSVKIFAAALFVILVAAPQSGWPLASNNIPLNSLVYQYIEKLAGFGLIKSDLKGIRPYSRSEAARLLLEAEEELAGRGEHDDLFARKIVKRLRELVPREAALRGDSSQAPFFDNNPLAAFRLRYVYLDGVPRSYERPVHDPGGDGVFGIGSGLRPDNPYPTLVRQHGTEGTPLLENNEGNRYGRGNNVELLLNSELYLKDYASALLEPRLSHSEQGSDTDARLNKAYAKLGGGGLELEAGRDAMWLGLGYRGAITQTNNAQNFDLVKLSSPEPLQMKYVGLLKYAVLFSRFDTAVTGGEERRPYFMAAKVSVKPLPLLELGINYGKQFGGPGVDNSVESNLKGIFGGTSSDNTNNLAGVELRIRLPFLRNAEIYGEFSGEDSASFWPIVESYLAGFYLPRLTASGKDDLRVEYFWGNSALYTSGTFPQGYIYKGMPVGHSQGGATQDLYVRYSHWFSSRNNVVLEYFHTERGYRDRVEVNGVMQAVERKNAWRASWNLPVYGDWDMNLTYGWERIHNLNLADGVKRTNQLFKMDLSYRY